MHLKVGTKREREIKEEIEAGLQVQCKSMNLYARTYVYLTY